MTFLSVLAGGAEMFHLWLSGAIRPLQQPKQPPDRKRHHHLWAREKDEVVAVRERSVIGIDENEQSDLQTQERKTYFSKEVKFTNVPGPPLGVHDVSVRLDLETVFQFSHLVLTFKVSRKVHVITCTVFINIDKLPALIILKAIMACKWFSNRDLGFGDHILYQFTSNQQLVQFILFNCNS